jgi:hypothetical protein
MEDEWWPIMEPLAKERWHVWQSQNPSGASSTTNAPTPADYGQQSGVVRRAQAMQAMTAAERASYRRGYQAHAQSVYRWRQRVLQALRSQLHGEGPESL